MFNLKVVNGKQVGFLGDSKIYVGRSSYGLKGSVLANKFLIGKDGSRAEVVQKYRNWLWVEVKKGLKGENNEVFNELVTIAKRVINGETIQLSCWCYPQSCHGDIIKKCLEWMIKENIVNARE